MKNLEALIEDYLKNCETLKKLNQKTLKAYRIDLKQFHTFMLPYPDFIDKVEATEIIATHSFSFLLINYRFNNLKVHSYRFRLRNISFCILPCVTSKHFF